MMIIMIIEVCWLYICLITSFLIKEKDFEKIFVRKVENIDEFFQIWLNHSTVTFLLPINF